MGTSNSYSWIKHVDFMTIDVLALIFSFAIAYRIKFGDFEFIHIGTWVGLLITVVLLNIVISFLLNPYSGIFRRRYYQEIFRSLQMAFFNFVSASVIFYAFKIGINYSRVMLFITYSMYFALSVILKYIWKKLLVSKIIVTNATKQIPLFVIGESDSIRETIHDVCAGDFSAYKVVGIHLLGETTAYSDMNVPDIQERYVQFVLNNNIPEVLVATSPGKIAGEIYKKLSDNGVVIHFATEKAIGFYPEEQVVRSLGIFQTLSTSSFSFSPKQIAYFPFKRAFDIIAGLVGIVVLLPICLLIKLAFLINGDTKSIFYRQKRVGKNGTPIEIYKFRSMVWNAEELLVKMLQQEEYRKEWEENQKFEEDPRITKVGKVLRKTSIDELPQLINVLKGDMSLVGPRPLVEGELEMHEGLKLYQKVKPGITGWWGCNGRSNIDYKERLELEYYYVKNCSFYLDLLCIFRTILAVLKKEGAK
ncbi:MAG: sugar transferase [Oscillospiraceae bacterium]|nr:sugar transferase [Oscillospiraceae bacterium]